MDMNHETPAKHMEYIAEADYLTSTEALKRNAFHAMDQLEGWCSKQKAAVLIDLICMTQPEVIVEIGVFGGKSLVPMAYALQANGHGKIYGIDPWDNQESMDGMDGVNLEWWEAVDHNKILRELLQKVHNFGLNRHVELIRATSELAPVIPNIDILHIDGNHSEKASLFDVEKWFPLVKKGGIIVFDDVSWCTTKAAVQWLESNSVQFVQFTGDNIWGIWVKP